MKAVKAASDRHKLRPLLLKRLPDRLVRHLRMFMRLRIGDAFVEKPGVELLIALHPKPRREEALTNQANPRLRGGRLWFSTCPFSQPAAGVHAVGSTR